MLVFDTKECPDASAADFGEADEKAEKSGMLDVVGENGVEDPIKTKNRVKDHGKIVDPCSFVPEHFAEEGVGSIRITETLRVSSCTNIEGSCTHSNPSPDPRPLLSSVKSLPKANGDLTAIYRVNGSTSYEECFVTR